MQDTQARDGTSWTAGALCPECAGLVRDVRLGATRDERASAYVRRWLAVATLGASVVSSLP